MIFICYPKCTTCQKARAWPDEHYITYNFRDIKLENPTYDELDRKSTRLNSSHTRPSRMPSSA